MSLLESNFLVPGPAMLVELAAFFLLALAVVYLAVKVAARMIASEVIRQQPDDDQRSKGLTNGPGEVLPDMLQIPPLEVLMSVKDSIDPDRDPDRFKHLPAPIRLADTVASLDERDVPDPDGGRDPERDFLIRYGIPL